MYGTEQAVRSFTLENYTSAEIVKILETEQLGDAVDLVAGGHVSMLVTEREVQGAQADYAAAKAAGLDLSAVEWVSKDEMEEVSSPFLTNPAEPSNDLEIRGIVSWLSIFRPQPLAPQSRHRTLQTRPEEEPHQLLTQPPHPNPRHLRRRYPILRVLAPPMGPLHPAR